MNPNDWRHILAPLMNVYMDDVLKGVLNNTTNDAPIDKSLPPEEIINKCGKSNFITCVSHRISDMAYEQIIKSQDAKHYIKQEIANRISFLAIDRVKFTQIKQPTGEVEVRGRLVIMSVDEFAKILTERL